MNYRKTTSSVGFLDLIQNTLIGFIILFIISFLMIKPVDEKPEQVKKAEYLITVTWDNNSNDDVDSWLEAPNGVVIFFKEKQSTMAHLDRDDLGWSTDKVTKPDGTEYVVPINQEIVTIRGIIPGEWTFNVHMFAKRTEGEANVVVAIDRLNPYTRIFTKTVILKKKGDEETILRFTMDRNGNIVSRNQIPKKIVKQKIIQQYNNNSQGGL
jgi:hypothetical protein